MHEPTLVICMRDYDYSTLTKYYDIFEGGERIEAFNEVLDALLQKYNAQSVLDLACGTGSQAIYLHKRGYDITAVDLSNEMLAMAQEKYQQLTFKQGDMRSSRVGSFDAVITIFNSIGHLSPPDFERALSNVSANLESGGIYVFDIFNLEFMRHDFISHEFIDTCKELQGTKYVRFNDNSLDSENGIMHINQKTYIQQGMQEPDVLPEEFDLQIYSADQLHELLERNGFEPSELLSMDGSSFDPEKSTSIVIVARKK